SPSSSRRAATRQLPIVPSSANSLMHPHLALGAHKRGAEPVHGSRRAGDERPLDPAALSQEWRDRACDPYHSRAHRRYEAVRGRMIFLRLVRSSRDCYALADLPFQEGETDNGAANLSPKPQIGVINLDAHRKAGTTTMKLRTLVVAILLLLLLGGGSRCVLHS